MSQRLAELAARLDATRTRIAAACAAAGRDSAEITLIAVTKTYPASDVLALAGLGLTACAITWHGFTFAEWWRESHSGFVLWKANTRQKVVALTFDDGPDPRYTPRILAILRQYGVKATFTAAALALIAAERRLASAFGSCELKAHG